MDSESDREVFLTQNKFVDVSDDEVNTDTIISDILHEGDRNGPNFDLKSDIFSDISEFEGDDASLIMACDEAETMLKPSSSDGSIKSRFASPLSEKDMNAFVETAVPKNTVNKSKWAVNLFNTWRDARSDRKWVSGVQVCGELLSMTNKELNDALGVFVIEVRNQAGDEYRPNTLYELITSIQHHIRANGRFINLLDDMEFASMRQRLDSKMKELSRKGIGLDKKKADVISVQQEEALWQKTILGLNSPQKLLDTVVYTFGLNFALRAGQEHRQLRVGEHSQLHVSEVDGRRFLEYREDVSKTYRGGIKQRKIEPKITRAYENLDNSERCPVRIYEQYMSLRLVHFEFQLVTNYARHCFSLSDTKMTQG